MHYRQIQHVIMSLLVIMLAVVQQVTYNVAVGQGALDANTTTDNNTAVGYNAMAANTTTQILLLERSALLVIQLLISNTANGLCKHNR